MVFDDAKIYSPAVVVVLLLRHDDVDERVEAGTGDDGMEIPGCSSSSAAEEGMELSGSSSNPAQSINQGK